jgi:hypothetical protein
MVALTSILPISLILLAIEPAEASQHTLVRRAFDSFHGEAARQTHSLARDLRVAFGEILPRSLSSSPEPRHVYCKKGRPQAPFSYPGNSTTGGGGSTTRSRPTSTKGSKPPANTGAPPNVPSSPWKLIESHQGSNFYDGWDFFTGGDPTKGLVDYIDENAGRSNGILEVNSAGNAIMRVETTPNVPGNRKSIRITTKSQFNGALVIMDSIHMPTGCGTWPAFWTNGPNWPIGGEIDIVEGVHQYTNNQATLHTDVGCTLPSKDSNTLAISGSVLGGTNCAVAATSNQGCGIRAPTSNTFGSGFNSNGGGVYAMRWDSTGVAIYFFTHDNLPADVLSDSPNPDSWPSAQARWPAAGCDPFKFFKDHHAIFDTTLCGEWAGAVWNSGGIPGQEQSCAERTGVATCDEYVRKNGDAFKEAYWEVKSVRIFQLKN